MVKYRLPKPQPCSQCTGMCYAYALVTRTQALYKVFWACNSCGDTFETVTGEKGFEVVDELPTDYDQYKGLVYQTITAAT